MTTCAELTWGSGWGLYPWGGPSASAGGPLPASPPFDIYCFGDCGSISTIFTHADVQLLGDTSQASIDGTTLQAVLSSGGGTFDTTDARVYINAPVPSSWTLEFTVRTSHLPANFTDLVNRHIFVGATDSAGPTAGLFISALGLLYTGAVVHDGAENLVLVSPTQLLPNSQVLVNETDDITYRIATDLGSGVTYIYVTKASDIPLFGHQLRYVMPAVASSSCLVVPGDETLISVRGTPGEEAQASFSSICLASGLVLPNLQPRSDAGLDQTVVTCRVVRLDGSRSMDPEGASLLYAWRLLDAPTGSLYDFESSDGVVYPLSPATGFTDHFYSVSLGVTHGISPFFVGDVLLIGNEPYVIESFGTDLTHGFFVRVHGYVIPDGLSANLHFKVLRQYGLSGRTTVDPTFYPDVPGLYKFDLIVFDGSLSSDPVTTVVNVVESAVPRGYTPDLRFLWGYLSDFWGLVEDRERLETFWSALSQVAAAELLNLWQVEYSKSLRDVQRSFQRKWLRYDLLMQENPLHLEETTAQSLFAGVASGDIPAAGTSGLNGQYIELGVPSGDVYRATVSGGGAFTADALAAQLQAQLSNLAPGVFTVNVVPRTDSTSARVRIDAPFAFILRNSSTLSVFTIPQTNSYPRGSAGGAVNPRTYRVDTSLAAMPIGEGDFLVLDGTAYRIARVISDPGDTYVSQRVTTLDDIPAGASSSWAIGGQATSPTLDFWAGMASAGDKVTFEVIRLADGQIAYVDTTALGAAAADPHTLSVDTDVLGYYLRQPSVYSVFFCSVLRRTHLPLDPLIVDIPFLQEKIKAVDDTQVLRRNVDFFLEPFRGAPCARFVTGSPDVWQRADPPARMWAEFTYLDNRPTIEANFGVPAEFTLDDLALLPDNVDYLSAVRGLWYAYFNGPTLFNIRAGTQILLGLPFAEEAGTIEEIRTDFSSTSGRLLVRDTANPEIVRSYSFPVKLDIETNPATGKKYVVGDSVAQFATLVTGVEVLDWVKDPTWFEGYMNQGHFLEVEKFFRFLVRIDSIAFNLNALLFVKSFIQRIKPKYTDPLFIVVVRIGDTKTTDPAEISVTDSLKLSGTLHLYDGANTPAGLGAATMFDEPDASAGGPRGAYRSHFDQGLNPTIAPTYPTAQGGIEWGFDRDLLCPEDAIHAILHCAHPGGVPDLTNGFFDDSPVHRKIYSKIAITISGTNILYTPVAGGSTLAVTNLASIGGDSINMMELFVVGDAPTTGAIDYSVDITINSSLYFGSVLFTAASYPVYRSFTVGGTIAAGDTMSALIRAWTSATESPRFEKVYLVIGTEVPWTAGVALPAGDYYSFRLL